MKNLPQFLEAGPNKLPALRVLVEHAQTNRRRLAAAGSMLGGNFLEPVDLLQSSNHRQHELQQHHHVQHGFLSIEGALVLLLYISLISEIVAIARGRYSHVSNSNSSTKFIRMLRPGTAHVGDRSCGICHDKRHLRSLDSLWRRMQKATNQVQLINLRHHMITKFMMEARMQARQREREKLQLKKAKLFASILTPIGKTVRKMGKSFDLGE